jgi:hypothetical protein
MGRVHFSRAIILARRFNLPNGTFGGVVYSGVLLEKLDAHFASLSIGREGAITLRDYDLAVIVRHGKLQGVTGQSPISPEFQALLKAGRASATYTAVTKVDGVTRINFFRKLQPYGQYLTVGLGRHEAFEPWRRELSKFVGIAALCLFLIIVSTWMANNAWHREQRAKEELEYMFKELQSTMADLRVLSGLLPICSHCKKIRDDKGYWSQIEAYITNHSAAQFSHGICPDCLDKHFPEIAKRMLR